MSSVHKLNPVYAALDTHQYNKAIKLCLALPATNLLGQALLAHAYAKSNQRYKALKTLQSILLSQVSSDNNHVDDENNNSNKTVFPELELEIKHCLERREQHNEATSQPTTPVQPSPSAASSKKTGKKGKKKAPPKPSGNTARAAAASLVLEDPWKDFDWVDQLDTIPQIDLGDDQEGIPAAPATPDLVEHTLLATMAMTMQSLRLQWTCFQLYTWVIRAAPKDLELVRQTFIWGLYVWMAPQYFHYPNGRSKMTNQSNGGGGDNESKLLAQLQVLAIQTAGLQQEQLGIAPATTWAAQTALWQLHANKDPAARSLAILPRLAESLASKAHFQLPAVDPLVQTENFWLYMRALDWQSKWEEKSKAIVERLRVGDERQSAATEADGNAPEATAPQHRPPRDTLLQLQVSCQIALGQVSEAWDTATDLLRRHADHWEYWKLLLELDGMQDDQGAMFLAFVDEIVDQTKEEKYPFRGPYLAKLERLARLERKSSESSRLDQILTDVKQFAEKFSPRASCTYNDLEGYLAAILNSGERTRYVSDLTDWLATSMCVVPTSDDVQTRRRELRRYTCGIQITYRILSSESESQKQDFRPPWKEILEVWRDFQQFDNSDQAQKESRPADELVLLAVQQLLVTESFDREQRLVIAVTILESAVQYSPFNAYLKMAAITVYAELNATSRAWELFRKLYIKHIQHESCAYIILPLLLSGGFYQEIVLVCQEILRLQTSAIKDANEFVGRAMENGGLTKATEFIEFQRNRINKSLTTLEAKGYILDCAPLMVERGETPTPLGGLQGIVGGPQDFERVTRMAAEAHNPYAAFSLLRLRGNIADVTSEFTENRDFSIHSYNILQEQHFSSKEEIVSNSMRRGYQHNLLIRSTLCLEATKGPKRGKITKNSEELKKRCASLLRFAMDAETFVSGHSHESPISRSMLQAMLSICRAIAAVSGGAVDNGVVEDDTLESREEFGTKYVNEASKLIQQAQMEFEAKGDVKAVSRFIADSLVPMFALFQMCASLFDTYGWGKRKQSSRRCAGALAEFSTTVKSLLSIMEESLMALDQASPFDGSSISDILGDDALKSTQKIIMDGRAQTKAKLEKVLTEIGTCLESFCTVV